MSQHPKAYLIDGGTVKCTKCPGQTSMFIAEHSQAQSWIEGLKPGIKLDETPININFGICQQGPKPGPMHPPPPCIFEGEWTKTVIPGHANEESVMKESLVAICKMGGGRVTVDDSGQISPFPVVNFGKDGITEEDIALYLLYSPEAFSMLDSAKNGKSDGIVSMDDLKAFLADAEGSNELKAIAGESFIDMLDHIVNTEAGREDWTQIEGTDSDSKMSRKDLEKAANNYLQDVIDPSTLATLVNALPEQKSRWDQALDAVQTGLDIVGMIPGIGEWADGLNALIYAGRGDWINAALCMASMIPVGGQAATTARIARNAGEELAQRVGREAAENFLQNAAKKAKDKAAELARRAKCTLRGEPIDVATGEVVGSWTDFELPGPIPFKWERMYYSQMEYKGYFGHRWQGNYEQYLEIHSDAIYFCAGSGYTEFPIIKAGKSYYNRQEKQTLKWMNGAYVVYDHIEGLTYHFRQYADENKKLITSISNRSGHTISFKYEDTRLLQIIDSAGRRLNIETDYRQRITGIIHKETRLMTYKYDDNGDLIKTTDALGESDRMYYMNHLLQTRTNRNRITFNWRYDGIDALAKCTKTWGDGNKLNGDFTYLTENKTIFTDSLGHQTTFIHHKGIVWEEISEEGHVKRKEYNQYIDLVKETDQLGRSTHYSYNNRGNQTAIVYPDGTTTKKKYTKDRLTAFTNPNGATWTWGYNENDELECRIAPDGAVTNFEYKQGLLKKVTDTKGQSIRLEHDKQYNLIETTYFDNQKNRWEYNSLGKCIKTTDARGNIRQYEYDLLGRMTQIHQADGNITKLKYDAYDGILRAIDLQHDVKFEYTELGKLKSRTEKGRTIQFVYDTEEQLTFIRNEKNNVYRFRRDSKGQVVEEIGFDGLTRKYLRDAAGQVNTIIRPNDKVINYKYDDNGRMYKVEHFDGSEEFYGYDKVGHLIEAVNQDATVTFKRDSLGRVIEETQNGYTVNSEYDLNGRSRITSSLGASIQLTRDEEHGYINAVSANHDDRSIWETQIKRDASGLEIERLLPGAIRSTWERDNTGKVIQHNVSKTEQIFRQKRYTWDINHRLKSIFDGITEGQIDFDHDSFGNLIGATYPDGQELFKTSDEVGNLFKTKDQSDRIYDTGSRLMRSPEWKYQYDDEGNLIRKTNRKTKESWQYAWNVSGMLKEVIRPDKQKVRFKYDALGRRIEKTFEDKSTQWVWNNNVPLHEWTQTEGKEAYTINKEGEINASIPENLTTWVFEDGSFIPMAKIKGAETYSIITDYLGTPAEMYDSEGNRVWACELDIYGKGRILEGKVEDCPFRYQGQYEDVETGLYYNRFRYYSAEEGRYISQDPIRLFSGEPNFYNYTIDVNAWLDALGLSPCTPNRRSSYPGASRRDAFRQARRDADIPMNQQPHKVDEVRLRDANSTGPQVMTREYHYTNSKGEPVVVQEHSLGHTKSNPGDPAEGPHFNVRQGDNTSKTLDGTHGHYNF